MIIQRVANVTEAVMVAEALKRQGSHEWFRGQTSIWPVVSSLLRLSPPERQTALARYGRLLAWAKQTPGLEDLVQHEDQLIAVAQHYGLPTNFVDFTTEPRVAGFFASHGKPPTDGRESCIICLNRHDLMQAVAVVHSMSARPEYLTITVPNLWRLEAQSGVFLYLPFENFEDTIHDFDRIMFPYAGPIAAPTDDEIYPKRKSTLEFLLDTYFMDERMRQGIKTVEESGVLAALPQRMEFTASSAIGVHPSWETPYAQSFAAVPSERYRSALSNVTWTLQIPPTLNSERAGEITASTIRDQLSQRPGARQELIHWAIKVGPVVVSNLAAGLRTALETAWDGLRLLPYTDDEIATALGNCARLYLAWVKRGLGDSTTLAVACDCFGEPVELAFGSAFGSARGYAARTDLLAALRPDIGQFVPPHRPGARSTDVEAILQLSNFPSCLFDFERFKKLFVEQLVPAQVVWGKHRSTIFSPVRLETLGLP